MCVGRVGGTQFLYKLNKKENESGPCLLKKLLLLISYCGKVRREVKGWNTMLGF